MKDNTSNGSLNMMDVSNNSGGLLTESDSDDSLLDECTRICMCDKCVPKLPTRGPVSMKNDPHLMFKLLNSSPVISRYVSLFFFHVFFLMIYL